MTAGDVTAALIVAIAAAATLYAARHAVQRAGWTWPRWMMPVGITAAMIGYQVWADYAWAPRLEASLPEGVVVLERAGGRQGLRPWTVAVPATMRMTTLDLRGRVVESGITRAPLALIARGQATRQAEVAADCAAGTGAVRLAEGGPEAQADPALVAAVCAP